MTKQEETQARLSEKIFEPILIIDDSGNEWDADKWLSYARCQRLELVTNKFVPFDELKKEYESEIQETEPGSGDSNESASD